MMIINTDDDTVDDDIDDANDDRTQSSLLYSKSSGDSIVHCKLTFKFIIAFL